MLPNRSVLIIVATLLAAPAASRAQPAVEGKPQSDGAALPAGAIGRLGTTQPKGSRPIVDLAVAPDGRYIAVVRMDQTIELWDGRTRCMRVLEVPGGKYRAAAFSADGKQLTAIGAYGDQTATVWETASGKTLYRLRSTTANVSGITPDGRFIVLTGKNAVRLIDAITESVRVQFAGPNLVTDTFPALDLEFAPDGRRLAAIDKGAEAGVIHVLTDSLNVNGSDMWKHVPVEPGLRAAPVAQWDAVTGAALPRLERAAPKLWRLVYAPDGRTVAALEFQQNQGAIAKVRCWESASGKLCRQIEWARAPLNCLAIAPDARRLAAGSVDGAIHFWDLATGKHLASRAGHRGTVWALRFAADGRSLYSAGQEGTVLIWDMAQVAAPALPAPAKLDDCLADLARPDASKAYLAQWALAAAPKQAVLLMRGRFNLQRPDDGQIRRWIADLDSDEYDRRQLAFQELTRYSHLAAAAAKDALRGNVSLELRRRLEQVLTTPPASLPLADVRTIQALELIGTPEARSVLEAQASGVAGTGPMREAAESLDRLKQRAATHTPLAR